MDPEIKGVSIVVCCYNSSTRLSRTLDFLAGQKVNPDVRWEIIVINNASTDDTREFAAAKLSELFPPDHFKVIDEPRPGLSFARKKGIHEAAYSYILFCDDDNWLEPYYAQKVYDFLELRNDVGIVSGQTEPVFEVPPPDWFSLVGKSYAIGKQESHSMATNSVWGAGMAIRKHAYIKLVELGFWHLNSDRLKDKLYCGGDTELSYAFARMGYVIWYEDSLILQHFIPAGRLSFNYAKKLFYYIGYSLPTIYVYSQESADFQVNSYTTSWIKASFNAFVRWVITIIRPAYIVQREVGIPKVLLAELVKGKLVKLLEWRGRYSKIRKNILEASWNDGNSISVLSSNDILEKEYIK